MLIMTRGDGEWVYGSSGGYWVAVPYTLGNYSTAQWICGAVLFQLLEQEVK